MKMMMIGMDGVSAENFDRGWTPYIKSLIEKGDKLVLKEDLISRGWSEIVTGKHAISTGALYEGPKANGTLDWSESFKLGDIPGLGSEIKPLWQVLNERGYRVGIMNVPTTYPAPHVDGFFVSGGGGGGPISREAAADQCFPPEMSQWLNEIDYIVDERRPSLLSEKGLYEPADFFDRLDVMNQRRTEAFIALAEKHEIDFGFVIFKSSTVTTETMLPAELEKASLSAASANYDFIKSAELFYRRLDKKIQKLAESFPEAELVLVSDHSMAIRRYVVNANEFLIEMGFQTPSKGRRSMFNLIKGFKHIVPYSIKQRLRKNKKIRGKYESMVTFDPVKTQAFSQAFSNGAHGIYINDLSRFGGPVQESDIKRIAQEIIERFNTHEISQKHKLRAYAKPDDGSTVAHKFPDIVLDLPDGYHTSNLRKGFVLAVPLPDTPLDLRSLQKEQRTVAKGHIPLAVNANSAWTVDAKDNSDLTLVYQHILNKFSLKNEIGT